MPRPSLGNLFGKTKGLLTLSLPIRGKAGTGFMKKSIFEGSASDIGTCRARTTHMSQTSPDNVDSRLQTTSFAAAPEYSNQLPVGSYHTPFLGYPTLWFWDPNPKIR